MAKHRRHAGRTQFRSSGGVDGTGMRQFRRISVPQGTSWAGSAIRTVAVIGDGAGSADISNLATYLPAEWQVISHNRFDSFGYEPDVIVLTDASAAAVRDWCTRFGDVPVVCTIAPDAAASEAIAVLRAGADACVRSSGPLVLGAHIRACQHRRQARMCATSAVSARISAVSGTGATA